MSNQSIERSKEEEIDLRDLFTSRFMNRYTDYDTIYALFDHYHLDLRADDALAALPEDQLDEIVRTETIFVNWQEMLGVAANDYINAQFDSAQTS